MADSCECNNNNSLYDDGDNECKSCAFPCTNCSSASVCITCDGLNRTAPECDCDVGYY